MQACKQTSNRGIGRVTGVCMLSFLLFENGGGVSTWLAGALEQDGHEAGSFALFVNTAMHPQEAPL